MVLYRVAQKSKSLPNFQKKNTLNRINPPDESKFIRQIEVSVKHCNISVCKQYFVIVASLTMLDHVSTPSGISLP